MLLPSEATRSLAKGGREGGRVREEIGRKGGKEESTHRFERLSQSNEVCRVLWYRSLWYQTGVRGGWARG